MKKKVISYLIVFLLGGLVFGSIGTVFALTYRASDITYAPTDNTWNVTTVGEAINDLALSKTSDNYSTDERVVGTWIDGKPIYQKSFKLENITSGVAMPLSTYIDNIDNVVYKNMIGYATNNNIYTEFYGANNDRFNLYVNKSNEWHFLINYSLGVTIKSVYITVQYTKTTDTVSN